MPVSPKKRGVDDSLRVTLIGTALLLWIPHSLAAMYECYCRSFFVETDNHHLMDAVSFTTSMENTRHGKLKTVPVSHIASVMGPTVHLRNSYNAFYYYFFPAGFDIAVFLPLITRVLLFSTAAILSTYVLAARVERAGELLMVLAWVLGVFSSYGWLTESEMYFSYSSNQNISETVLGSSTISLLQSGGGSLGSSFASANSTGSFNSSSSSTAAEALFLFNQLPQPPAWLWLAVSLMTGFFSGVLCKVKDIMDGKHVRGGRSQGGRRYVGIGDRLYMVVPFCTGQWFTFILQHGWRGIIVANGMIVLSLGMIGYTMLSYQCIKTQILGISHRKKTVRKVVRRKVERSPSTKDKAKRAVEPKEGTEVTVAEGEEHNATGRNVDPRIISTSDDDDAEEEEYEEVVTTIVEDDGRIDLIELFSTLCTTSFGVVFAGIIGMNIFVTSLAIPFLKALFHLNALATGVGIVVELIMYEIA